MKNILNIALFGTLSGMIGTGIGGFAAILIKNISNRILSLILEFSAGLMTAVVCFELIPEAFSLGRQSVTLIGVIAGAFTILVVENYLMKAAFLNKKGNAGLVRAGLMTAIGIALHNLPEGFAVGAGFEASTKLGLALTLVILIHDIPEGVSMALPLKCGGFSGTKAFMLTVLSGVPMGIGALIGAFLGVMSKEFISLCLGFAGGAMLYIVYGEILPESKKLYRGRLPSVGNVTGIIMGIILISI